MDCLAWVTLRWADFGQVLAVKAGEYHLLRDFRFCFSEKASLETAVMYSRSAPSSRELIPAFQAIPGTTTCQ
jgi:hypothetical protein